MSPIDRPYTLTLANPMKLHMLPNVCQFAPFERDSSDQNAVLKTLECSFERFKNVILLTGLT